ncbi:2-succinyl-6-hydroxy-2,4-cyclohexadiene-1-carboxylate synthase [Billgrantia endophytica]|uniref:Putative 2-succinyl-6-hydroxy-2,4-cyclohexadiene-1-carboxylate synthase n=1 Tax=Billgrantia endophytica TaxID=2033802 RepID=A0A2N7U3V5_9GAMM|nr:2-succinyl-6-hydroxy-2,4-cyclohexadiene-1-carboxylate synthase [Halomonas endophytica]
MPAPPPKPDEAPIVLLHGLLGDRRDWRALIERLPEQECIALELPGHGANRHRQVDSFDEAERWFTEALAALGVPRYRLLGYSLGGRLALYHASQRPPGLVSLLLESAHPGLPVDERAARLSHDMAWAGRFGGEPLEAVLEDWYRQPVFADLDAATRRRHVARRLDNDGPAVAAMLRATSLGRQPDLVAWLSDAGLPVWYLSGRRDAKFHGLACRLAQRCHHVRHVALDGGHNLHATRPGNVAEAVRAWCRDGSPQE